MDRQHYTTSQFAQKAAVTVWTLRFYDKVGLLSPSGYTEAGHRLYSGEDLWNLQQILALKFLGFSQAPSGRSSYFGFPGAFLHLDEHRVPRLVSAIISHG